MHCGLFLPLCGCQACSHYNANPSDGLHWGWVGPLLPCALPFAFCPDHEKGTPAFAGMPCKLFLQLDVQRFFQLLEFAVEILKLLADIEAFSDIVEAVIDHAGQLLNAFANVLFGRQRCQCFREDLLEALLGELSHEGEVNGE